MACDRCNCYFPLWAIFCPFTPQTARKITILQKWKNQPEISLFYTFVPKILIRWCTVPEIWCVTDWQTDRWMDGQTNGRMDRKSDILRRVPQLKINPTIDIFRSFGRPVYWLGRPNSGAQKTVFKFAFFRMDLLISKWLRIKKWKQKRKTMRQRGQSDRKNCQ